tara:strand:- start:835 stop:1866 length:1032 start_codon:yes stop_codon:yes gene_type:complete
MPNTWNQSGTTWNEGRWGTQNAITSGWGADAWNTGGSWGQATDELVTLTGQSATLSIGTPIAAAQQGWGRDEWGEEPWGESFDPVVKPSGLSTSLSLGSVSISAQIAAGWGQDGWGVENWGQSGLTFEITAPDGMSSFLGTGSAWNNGSWGQPQAWNTFVLSPADVVGLAGQSLTASVGSPTPIIDFTGILSGVSATASVGSISPADVVGLSGVSATVSVGSISPADVVGISGVSSTFNVGSVSITPTELILVTGVSSTLSVGSVTVADMAIGLASQTATFSVGSISPADVVGLTGQQITSSVAGFGTSTGFGIQAYQDVDTGSNISYSNVATGTNITYSDVA